MAAIGDLSLGDRDRGVPVLGQNRFAKGFGTVGVGSFADHQESGRRVVALLGSEGLEAVDRGGAVLMLRVQRGGLGRSDGLCELADVLRCGATAPADDPYPEIGHESCHLRGEVLGAEVVVHLAVDHRGEPGVGQHRDGYSAVLGEVANVLTHLRGASCAVEPDDIGPHRVEGAERCGDLCSGQHAPGGLDGHLGLDRHLASDPFHRPSNAVHRRLDAEQVELGFDDEQVDPAFEEADSLFLVEVAQRGVGDLSERRELGAGSHRSGDESRTVGGGERVGHVAGGTCRGEVDLVGSVLQVVFAERNAECAEAVRLDDIRAGGEVVGVHLGDDVGPGDRQKVGAPVEGLTAEVVGGQADLLQVGARGAIEDHDAFAQKLQVRVTVRLGGRRLDGQEELLRGNCGVERPLASWVGPLTVLCHREPGPLALPHRVSSAESSTP